MKSNIKRTLFLIAGIAIIISASSCKKYLEAKSDQKLDIPSNLNDYQALLDNYAAENTGNPSCGEVSTNDYYLTDADYAALYYEADRRMYAWQKSFIFLTGDLGNDWENCYTAVYFNNTVLEGIKSIERTPSNAVTWDNIKGQALVHRANRFLGALQIWSQAYDSKTASTDLGIPLRLNTDFNQKSVRASVQAGYDQVISDLKSAIPLLPVISTTITRPSKVAAYAYLARTYLFMRDYDHAGLYADSSLQLNKQLLDFNSLNAASPYPITSLNAEIINYQFLSTEKPVNKSIAKIDSNLYKLYENNDLRKTMFFKDNRNGTFGFRGNYTTSFALFGGPATDEMYLIRAESAARKGNTTAAISDLNTLLVTRYQTGTFVGLKAVDANDALSLVLLERRKELLMRGLRWSDIKRLNKENAGISMTRVINGVTISISPGDSRFVLPIPEDVIAASGMQQNP